MKINRKNAFRLWEERYGKKTVVKDFHGNWMYKEGYGNPHYRVRRFGKLVYGGWNLHHILPASCGGTNEETNLICTNIRTNQAAQNKITYWVDNSLYQVKHGEKKGSYEIKRLQRARGK